MVTLIYRNLTQDFEGLFSFRRIFCLGLITGAAVLDFVNFLVDQINPERLPIDTVEDEEGAEEGVIFKYQVSRFIEKVRLC